MEYDNYQEFFSMRLNSLREKKGVSARNMSLSIGQCESYVNSIENQKILPSMTTFFYICEYLEISPKDFFDETILYPNEFNEFIEEIKDLTSDELNHLLLLVKDLNKKSGKIIDSKTQR